MITNFSFRHMKKRKKIVIHKIYLQNKNTYIVKEITLIHVHKCHWHVTTLKLRVDCNIINRYFNFDKNENKLLLIH